MILAILNTVRDPDEFDINGRVARAVRRSAAQASHMVGSSENQYDCYINCSYGVCRTSEFDRATVMEDRK